MYNLNAASKRGVGRPDACKIQFEHLPGLIENRQWRNNCVRLIEKKDRNQNELNLTAIEKKRDGQSLRITKQKSRCL
jgi:hypothetical protein